MAVVAIAIVLVALIPVIMKLLFLQQQHQASRFDPENSSNYGSSSCVVCLTDLAHGDEFQQLPKCGHCFHARCIDAWFESSGSATCPLCRTLVFDHPPISQTGSNQPSCFLKRLICAVVISVAEILFSKVGCVSNFEEGFKLL
uniref:RING-type domain-containing protein n=1 Tax=Kalanchoe fedtschenkoi TaxID=63787 RepID=A0A7N0TIX2_KALFE